MKRKPLAQSGQLISGDVQLHACSFYMRNGSNASRLRRWYALDSALEPSKLIACCRPPKRCDPEPLRDPNCRSWLPGSRNPAAASPQSVRHLAPCVDPDHLADTLFSKLQKSARQLSRNPLDLICRPADKSTSRDYRLHRPRSQSRHLHTRTCGGCTEE